MKKWNWLSLVLVLALISGLVLVSGCGSNSGGVGLLGSSSNGETTFTKSPPMPPEAVALDRSSNKGEPLPKLDPDNVPDGPIIPPGEENTTRDTQNHAFAAGWNSMSFPFDTPLTSTTGFTYYLYHWNLGTETYNLIDPANVGAIDCADGFWTYSDAGSNVQAQGANFENTTQVTLNAGWNFFAFPLRSNVTFDKLSMTYLGETKSLGNAASFQTSPSSAWAYARIYYYDNGGWYQLKCDNGANSLQTWHGYWIFSWHNNVTLNFRQPVVSSVSPTTGTPLLPVTVLGQNFGNVQGTSKVEFNGTDATTISSWLDSIIQCEVPIGATTGPVLVTTNYGTSNADVIFTVSTQTHVDSVTPSSGPVGTTVTITGSNFNTSQGVGTVTFNGTDAGLATSWTYTQIICDVPVGASTGPVVVTTTNGVSNSDKTFTVTTPPPTPPSVDTVTPNSGPTGTTVTIDGNLFGVTQVGGSTIAFNGTDAGVATSWSDTEIVCDVPVGATTGEVVVTVGGQASSNGPTFTVTNPATYDISGTVKEISGTAIQSATVTVVGTGLSDDTDVNGAFAVNNVPAGDRLIRVTKANYTPTRIYGNVSGDITGLDLPLVQNAAFDTYHPTGGSTMILTKAQRHINGDALSNCFIDLSAPATYTDRGEFPGSNTCIDWLNTDRTYKTGYTIFYGVADGGSDVSYTVTKATGYTFTACTVSRTGLTNGEIVYDLCQTTAAPATFTVSGMVEDMSGSPVAGLTIEVQGSAISDVTGGDGTYTLTGVPYGRQLFVLNRTSFNATYPKINQYKFVSENVAGYDWGIPTVAQINLMVQNGTPAHPEYSYDPTSTTKGYAICSGNRQEPDGDEMQIGYVVTDLTGTWTDKGYMKDDGTSACQWTATYSYANDNSMRLFYRADPGTYTLTVGPSTYYPNWQFESGVTGEVFAGEITQIEADTINFPAYTVSGTLADYGGTLLSGVDITANRNYYSSVNSLYNVTTGGDGSFSLTVPSGTWGRSLYFNPGGSYKQTSVCFSNLTLRGNLTGVQLPAFTAAQYNTLTGGGAHSWDASKAAVFAKYFDENGQPASGVTSDSNPAFTHGYWNPAGNLINWGVTTTYAGSGVVLFEKVTAPIFSFEITGTAGATSYESIWAGTQADQILFQTSAKYYHP
ncbi:MAG: IPT/TIG domain-containing protein [Chloroflexi bacterium]|nr:IPT/TIG domain-containing protein [Chloroflexota bacterium]